MATGRPRPGEFDLIARYLAPLAAGEPLAFGLTDDAALLRPTPGHDLVVTKDALVAGVHFLPEDPPETVGRKLLRVNLSDLASMGARPRGYLLATAWPDQVEEPWIAAFAAGLADDQRRFGIDLLGGDTVATPGPLTLSLTALGEVETGQALRRAGARPGDRLFVSGVIGDGHLGLAASQGRLGRWPPALRDPLVQRYRLPEPRLPLGRALLGIATAAIDVSDGLIADLDHLCDASTVGARLAAADVPLSLSGERAVAEDGSRLSDLLTGGDDYELLFTCPDSLADKVTELARGLEVAVTCIGEITPGSGIDCRDAAGDEMRFDSQGFSHF